MRKLPDDLANMSDDELIDISNGKLHYHNSAKSTITKDDIIREAKIVLEKRAIKKQLGNPMTSRETERREGPEPKSNRILRWLKRKWHDPVWSKVIATVIASTLALPIGYFGFFKKKSTEQVDIKATAAGNRTEQNQNIKNGNSTSNLMNISNSSNVTVNQTQNVGLDNRHAPTDTSSTKDRNWTQKVKRFENAKPRLIRPFDRTIFESAYHDVTLIWEAVTDANHYEVEVQWQHYQDKSWHLLPAYPMETKDTTFTFKFVGGTEFKRWRVVAINIDGIRSNYSDWYDFAFTNKEK